MLLIRRFGVAGGAPEGRRLMKFTVAFCAVLIGTGIGCTSAPAAPARTASASNPFDDVVVRPPRSIPHVRPAHAAAAPVPRPKPAASPAAPAPASGPIVFPPVAPLE
jgi:hypothetical protein